MPLLKVDHVISFSSEDSVHVADNILSIDSSKKWKCRNPGEKNVVIVLQLEKASLITGVDIGNEHSAYVEILVSRSENKDDFKVLLTMCSFMTPVESRQSQNVNKVRMFSKNDLSKPECDEKWDRIKIVCTQPFNKHVQYGLNFINFHTNDIKVKVPVQSNKIGNFVLRPESPNDVTLGSLFVKQKDLKQEEKLTGAAAIREASSTSSLAIHGSPLCKPKLKTQNAESPGDVNSSVRIPKLPKKENGNVDYSPKPRNKNELFYSKDELELDEESNNKKLPKVGDNKIKKVVQENSKQNKNSPLIVDKRKCLDISVNNANKKKETTKRKNKHSSSLEKIERKKLKQEKPSKPFNRLLEGVTLVISGIANPDRGNLRSQAISMGAKYKPDWNNSCTHLICAFLNTPKYNQVKGKGKIVKQSWIEECYSQRKRLPWRRYALDRNDQKQDESEDEIVEQVVTNTIQSADEDDFNEHIEEASDTEERLLNTELASTSKAGPSKVFNFEDVYSADTDVEEDCSETVPNSPEDHLKNIFKNKKFYVDEGLKEELFTKVNKYIVAYNGRVITDQSLEPNVIITTLENSSQLKKQYPDVDCVGPDWIWHCHNKQNCEATTEFLY